MMGPMTEVKSMVDEKKTGWLLAINPRLPLQFFSSPRRTEVRAARSAQNQLVQQLTQWAVPDMPV
jgi:hypothetical protein